MPPGFVCSQKVLVRADASLEIGSGHVMRCLTLAGQLREHGAEVVFVCRDLPGGMSEYLRAAGYGVILLPGHETDASATSAALRTAFPGGADWLIVDHYGLDIAWEQQLRPHARKLMVIDDLADRRHDCDLLLDQNYYRDLEHRYDGLVPPHCRKLLGPAYLLLREEFKIARKRLRQRDGSVRNVLVFFGGSDPANETRKAVEAFGQLNLPEVAVQVVVGAANPNREVLEKMCGELSKMTFHCQVSNMAEMITRADLGIGAGGSSMWERCFLGLPTITVVFADNQQRTTEDVAATGAIKYLGWSDQLSPGGYARTIAELVEDSESVRRIGAAALNLVSGPSMPVAQHLFELNDDSGDQRG